MHAIDINLAWVLVYAHSGHSVLTKGQVLDSLASFFPNISAREVKALVGPGNLSSDKLRALLINPEAPLVRAGNIHLIAKCISHITDGLVIHG